MWIGLDLRIWKVRMWRILIRTIKTWKGEQEESRRRRRGKRRQDSSRRKQKPNKMLGTSSNDRTPSVMLSSPLKEHPRSAAHPFRCSEQEETTTINKHASTPLAKVAEQNDHTHTQTHHSNMIPFVLVQQKHKTNTPHRNSKRHGKT